MNWVYYFSRIRKNTDTQADVEIYLRPYMHDANNEMLVGERVVFIHILCLGNLFESEQPYDENMTKAEFDEIRNTFYGAKLGGAEYNIEMTDLSGLEREVFHAKYIIYLADKSLTIDEVWDWVHKLFILYNYPAGSFKEGTYNEFIDTNEIMQMFTMKNVKKFEKTLGKEWWKGKDDKEKKKE